MTTPAPSPVIAGVYSFESPATPAGHQADAATPQPASAAIPIVTFKDRHTTIAATESKAAAIPVKAHAVENPKWLSRSCSSRQPSTASNKTRRASTRPNRVLTTDESTPTRATTRALSTRGDEDAQDQALNHSRGPGRSRCRRRSDRTAWSRRRRSAWQSSQPTPTCCRHRLGTTAL